MALWRLANVLISFPHVWCIRMNKALVSKVSHSRIDEHLNLCFQNKAGSLEPWTTRTRCHCSPRLTDKSKPLHLKKQTVVSVCTVVRVKVQWNERTAVAAFNARKTHTSSWDLYYDRENGQNEEHVTLYWIAKACKILVCHFECGCF